MVRICLSTLILSDIAFWLCNKIFENQQIWPGLYMMPIFDILSKFISAHVCIAFSLTTSRQQASFATTTRQQISFAIFATAMLLRTEMQIPLFILWLFPNKNLQHCVPVLLFVLFCLLPTASFR